MSKTLLDACSDLSGVLGGVGEGQKRGNALADFRKHKLPVNLGGQHPRSFQGER